MVQLFPDQDLSNAHCTGFSVMIHLSPRCLSLPHLITSQHHTAQRLHAAFQPQEIASFQPCYPTLEGQSPCLDRAGEGEEESSDRRVWGGSSGPGCRLLAPCSTPSSWGGLEAAAVTSHLCCCSCWSENSLLLGRLAQGVKSSAPRERQEPAKGKN